MAAEKDGRIALTLFGIERGKGIAVSVDFYGIGKLAHIINPDFLAVCLKTGRGGGIEQGLEEFVRGAF